MIKPQPPIIHKNKRSEGISNVRDMSHVKQTVVENKESHVCRGEAQKHGINILQIYA